MKESTVSLTFPEKDIHLDKFYEILKEISEIVRNSTCISDLSKVFYKLLFNAEDYFIEIETLLIKNEYPKLKDQKKLNLKKRKQLPPLMQEITQQQRRHIRNCWRANQEIPLPHWD